MRSAAGDGGIPFRVHRVPLLGLGGACRTEARNLAVSSERQPCSITTDKPKQGGLDRTGHRPVFVTDPFKGRISRGGVRRFAKPAHSPAESREAAWAGPD